ncbi:GIY-YIG nuclease family protein [Agriterribacter sp.]|uniref:GIY-YIG nuclease family protein n=1 Tax=Agriterribacter sp. TaxID=2821509 RepID=UPI002CC380B0|nr:GIY-YIG nuclease family protein [Agriterribacter sp.]HRO48017.1 GIY-YIG nuclease family protein [Agriterribacter sp.]HRQ15741.1 GIY-YIG nuclease family protein [Agriterribacter sp.]
MSSNKKISLDDIFNDDDFGLLDSKAKVSNIKSEEDRLIDSFEEINTFFDKNGREPNASSMSEYGFLAKLKNFRQDEQKKRIVKPFDRHNLLGEVEMEKPSIDDILNDDDFGLLDTGKDLAIFKYKHIPKEEERAEADFVAQRKPMKEKDFKPYEEMFQKVHQEIKEGKRKLLPFYSLEKNLKPGNFYIVDGVMLYLESANLDEKLRGINTGNRVQMDGRTRTIFENGTYSNMLYRSLGKQIQNSGKLITNTYESIQDEFFDNESWVKEEDIQTGWIYVLKSKSTHPEIAAIKDLYKIGFSTTAIEERIRNAKSEATYLFADVIKVASYACYNQNADKLEQLLHRFFASACLNIDLFTEQGQRLMPREWFVVPFEVIEEAIRLILNGEIIKYKYDTENGEVVEK